MLLTFIAIQALVLLAAADMHTVSDASIIGTWKSTCETCFDVHGTGWIAYHYDHTCTLKSYSNQGASFAHGTWKIRGRELITRFPPIVGHETILTIAPDQFKTRAKIGDHETIFTYTRIKGEP